MKWTLLFVVLAFFCIDELNAKVVKGDIKSKDEWAFVSKFCFNNMGVGNLTWQIDTAIPNMQLLIYLDGLPSNLKKMSCQEKIAAAHSTRTIVNGAITHSPFVDRIRPHYWYFAIVNCQPDGNGEIYANYNFTFLNGGGGWNTQYSFDEAGLPIAFIFYWFLFVVVGAVHYFGVWNLWNSGSYHPTVKVLTVCLTLEIFYTMFAMIHYAVYKNNGIGVPGLLGFGELLDLVYQIGFMFLLILLGKGYSVSKSEITERIPVIVVMSLFLVFYLSMFIWEYVSKNTSVLYVYESAPGIIILVLRVAVLGWFLWNLRKSFVEETEPAKRTFYLRFGGFYTLYFLILPIIVIIASLLANWIRLKVVMSMYLTMNFLSTSVLVALFWPNRARDLFSFIKGASGEGLLSGKSSSPYETL